MRVIILNDMLWGGGRERRIVQLIAGLNKAEIREITLVLLDPRVDYEEVFELGVRVIKIERSSNRDLAVFWKLFKIIRDVRPDVINPWSFMTIFYAAPLSWMMNIPCVGSFVVDAKAPRAFSINWIAMHIGFLLCKSVVSNSNAGHVAYSTPKRKRRVIYNGFNFGRLKKLAPGVRQGENSNSSSELTRLAMIGRLDRQKDFLTYFDALKILEKKGVEYIAYVAGQGEMSENLEEYVRNNNIASVVFSGFVRDVDSFIASIDIGVLCTDPNFHAEGISNSILEIMAQGKPVVATDGGGTPEIITDQLNGYIVESKDYVSLAERLERLCRDKVLRLKLGEEAARTIQERFSLDRMTDSFVRVYHEC